MSSSPSVLDPIRSWACSRTALVTGGGGGVGGHKTIKGPEPRKLRAQITPGKVPSVAQRTATRESQKEGALERYRAKNHA